MITKKKLRAEIEKLKRELELKESERGIILEALNKASVENLKMREKLSKAPSCNTTYIKTSNYKTEDLIQRIIIDDRFPRERECEEIKNMMANKFVDELLKKDLIKIKEDIDPVNREKIFTAILKILI